jgi:hypothetical protein
LALLLTLLLPSTLAAPLTTLPTLSLFSTLLLGVLLPAALCGAHEILLQNSDSPVHHPAKRTIPFDNQV